MPAPASLGLCLPFGVTASMEWSGSIIMSDRCCRFKRARICTLHVVTLVDWSGTFAKPPPVLLFASWEVGTNQPNSNVCRPNIYPHTYTYKRFRVYYCEFVIKQGLMLLNALALPLHESFPPPLIYYECLLSTNIIPLPKNNFNNFFPKTYLKYGQIHPA